MLRDELDRRRRRLREETTLRVYRPMLREAEETFLASLPADTWTDAPTAREIHAARSRGERPSRGQALPPFDPTWLQLREHEEAARACYTSREIWQNSEGQPEDGHAWQGEGHTQDPPDT